MQVRHVVAVSFGFKVVIVLLCFSLVYANRLFGETYFNPTLSAADQKAAVKNAKNVDARDRFGDTGLMYSANQGMLPLAKTLVKNGAHLNLQSVQGEFVGLNDKVNGQTALHYAVTNIRLENNKKVAYYLINVYADPNVQNAQKNTPLHLTAASTDNIPDRTALAIALVKNGAHVDTQNFQGNTLMHFAANAKSPDWIEGMMKAFGHLVDMNIKNNKGFTPYEFAVDLGFPETAAALKKPLPPFPKANEYNLSGLTGLMLAAMKKDQKLLSQMVTVRNALNLKSKDEYQNSAMHMTLIFDNNLGLKTLLDKGASSAIANAKGEIPLMFLPRMSSAKNRIQAATMLLKKNPKSMLTKNKKGENIVHYIVRYDDRELLKFLIDNHRAIVRQASLAKNNALQSPLNLAGQMRRKNIATQLRALRKDVLPVKK